MDRKFWLDLALIALLAMVLTLLFWIFRELGLVSAHAFAQLQWPVLPGCSLLAIAVAVLTWCTRYIEADRQLKNVIRTPNDMSIGVEATHDISRTLPEAMRLRYGLRWRYQLPWLLLVGEASAVRRLAPELATRGFGITGDAVLVWGGAGLEGRPVDASLRQIRRLRRRRPIDAVVLTLDGEAQLTGAAHGMNSWGGNLVRITDVLRWSAPVYVLDIAGTDSIRRHDTPVTGCEFASPLDASVIESHLLELRDRLADRGVYQLADSGEDVCASELSKRLDTRSAPLARWIAALTDWQRRPLRVAGAFFAPLPADSGSTPGLDSAHLPLWRYLAEASTRTPGHRTLAHPHTVFSVIAFAAIGLWSAGMLVSGINNAHEVMLTKDALQALDRAGDTPARLRALLALQQRIGLHEARVQEHTPLFTRFGLNHDRAVLDALWTPYARAARPLLIAPVQQDIEGQLVDLGQMSTAQFDAQGSQMAQDGEQALKTYLMMAEPQRADPAFMAPEFGRHWNLDTGLRPGEKLDFATQLMGFWTQHLAAHPDWRIQPRGDLVGNARQTLLAAIGVKSSEDTIYQGILDSVGHKYPDQTLASLTAGTDARGLFRTTATMPGVFTRQAWEGSIEAAIDEAAKHNGVTADWVLGNAGNAQGGAAQDAETPEALRTALRKRYFADYGEHWQDFMNSLRLDAATTLPSAVGQLRLIADSRQSPVIALMKSLAWQGGAGAQQASISDALVTKAQNLFGKKGDTPQAAQPDPSGPLGAAFGPVLRLVGQGSGAGSAGATTGASDLSLERFTERVTTLRLKLQQISDSPDSDEQAREVAQALYQGKGSDLSDTLGYAKLIAASLGEQWAGMGNTLFVEPVTQAARTVLAPAESSLNDAWRQSIVAAWNQSFAGRYPFASTPNDVSLPELARFLKPQGGVLDTFLTTQLAGALQLQGDQWVPASGGAGAGSTSRAFDPAFLKAINTLHKIAAHLLAQGEPQYVFSLKPVPVPGITDTLLTLDGQSLHYYNQLETWSTMTWPSGEPQKAGTRLEWQTESAGTSRSFEFSGRWALVRMLERATVEPLDSATYQLTWRSAAESAGTGAAVAKAGATTETAALNVQGPLAPAPAEFTHPVHYIMRTDVGRGPLELLALRGFELPSRIFMGRTDPVAKPVSQLSGPPPLPKAAIAAAKQATVSLPAGVAP
ncbi:ImcF-related family protein [Paraburkholderia bannensis]|uniref:ImcF-related family protein n=1 Tax=Paraburkholderia bannensis TaxID=765414 RepID=UPI002AB63E94|nr:ImcF-related family protein [Paraburkholderia bannensis]